MTPDPDDAADIESGGAQDADNPEWTEADFARARRTAEMPKLRDLFEPETVFVHLDSEVADRLKAEGPDWEARANAILRRAVGLD